jgi:hypothetical protein
VHHASVSRSLALVLALILVACGSNDGTPGPTGPATASATQGRFSLTFTVASATVHSRDEITGLARLTLLAPGGVTFSGSNTILGFEFSEVGGNHRLVAPAFDAVCAPHRITGNTPIDSPIVKSGAVVEGPDAAWYRQFLTGSTVKLPAGDWDITAIGDFFDGQGCVGQHLDIRATVRVHVID